MVAMWQFTGKNHQPN